MVCSRFELKEEQVAPPQPRDAFGMAGGESGAVRIRLAFTIFCGQLQYTEAACLRAKREVCCPAVFCFLPVRGEFSAFRRALFCFAAGKEGTLTLLPQMTGDEQAQKKRSSPHQYAPSCPPQQEFFRSGDVSPQGESRQRGGEEGCCQESGKPQSQSTQG